MTGSAIAASPVDNPSTTFVAAVYGTKGVPNSNNRPESNSYSCYHYDSTNQIFYTYGGYYNGSGSYIDSLWSYNLQTNLWTWLSGSQLLSQPPNYGTLGVPSSSVTPGGRMGCHMTKINGKIYVFGGRTQEGWTNAFRDDLFSFDGTNWTWEGGSNTTDQTGNYGTMGVTSSSNWPPSRAQGAYVTDPNTNTLWIFGGDNPDWYYGDLWKFDGTNWTWVSGSSVNGTHGVYNGSGNVGSPCGRIANMIIDRQSNLWMFGGHAISAAGFHNTADLWKFNGSDWILLNGTCSEITTDPTINVPNATQPMSMKGSPMWVDPSGIFFLLGGHSNDRISMGVWLYAQ
jgi:hypothetical protein